MSDKIPKLIISSDEKHQNGEAEEPLINSPVILTDKLLGEDFEEIYRNYPLSDDTTCGIGFIRGRILQK
jgi:hypothetical protein